MPAVRGPTTPNEQPPIMTMGLGDNGQLLLWQGEPKHRVLVVAEGTYVQDNVKLLKQTLAHAMTKAGADAKPRTLRGTSFSWIQAEKSGKTSYIRVDYRIAGAEKHVRALKLNDEQNARLYATWKQGGYVYEAAPVPPTPPKTP